MTFDNQTIVVLGATGGIGSALARRLHQAGARLHLVARGEARLSTLAAELNATHTTADATRFAEVDRAVQQAGGPIYGVVNCVGSILLKPAHATTEDEWQSTLQLNLTSAFAAVRAAAKAGILGLTLSAAATYAPKNLRVNCVAPGLVDTPLAARVTGNPASLEASRAMHALGRIGSPGHIAAAIAYFLDPANDWVTGQILGVDGGLGSIRPR
ncbi:MAG: SDR family oxidoreductase [Bryobacterales bacterium]|nr:SDR family oxidoreductase [Bryobacterales bacterium]